MLACSKGSGKFSKTRFIRPTTKAEQCFKKKRKNKTPLRSWTMLPQIANSSHETTAETGSLE